MRFDMRAASSALRASDRGQLGVSDAPALLGAMSLMAACGRLV